jgi:hypothetical protein
MARPFDFGRDAIFAARVRQKGLCAVCGFRLRDSVEHAHHVIPNQSGDPEDSDDDWLRRTENCVYLCSICHSRVHQNGRYRNGAVAPPTYFEYSHGKGADSRQNHRLWASKLDAKAEPLWQRLSEKAKS